MMFSTRLRHKLCYFFFFYILRVIQLFEGSLSLKR